MIMISENLEIKYTKRFHVLIQFFIFILVQKEVMFQTSIEEDNNQLQYLNSYTLQCKGSLVR